MKSGINGIKLELGCSNGIVLHYYVDGLSLSYNRLGNVIKGSCKIKYCKKMFPCGRKAVPITDLVKAETTIGRMVYA